MYPIPPRVTHPRHSADTQDAEDDKQDTTTPELLGVMDLLRGRDPFGPAIQNIANRSVVFHCGDPPVFCATLGYERMPIAVLPTVQSVPEEKNDS